ncbi:YdcF family protein [Myxosarcina sp. GI1]|uniref:YdcF family protein n=1 Tax=Myxosarcina sp. GI1 TaxID=1541065 RepID=UPI000563D563|nr:YdcF family protein [Myxosarcina sp. GI1]
MDFLFFSKLLPLLIYPVGLSCVLLLWALFFSRKRSRPAFIPVLLALIILFTAGNEKVSSWLVKSLEWQNLPPDNLPLAEAIVVLGGATYSVEPPRVMPEINQQGDRLLYAAKLYKDGKAPVIILSGGRIPWYGNPASEAADMATLLRLMGVPQTAMILEPDSLNTYQNAIYTKKILTERKINQILLVTSAIHMPRSLAIFNKQDISAIAAPTDFLVTKFAGERDESFQTRILSLIPASIYLDWTTNAIKEYIGFVIYRLKGWL